MWTCNTVAKAKSRLITSHHIKADCVLLCYCLDRLYSWHWYILAFNTFCKLVDDGCQDNLAKEARQNLWKRKKEFVKICKVISFCSQVRNIYQTKAQKVKSKRANVDKKPFSIHSNILDLAHCLLNFAQTESQDYAGNNFNQQNWSHNYFMYIFFMTLR